jgi:hypothetical protein
LVINREKCVFGLPEIEFLGHKVAAAGVSPLPKRVAAIRQLLRPGDHQGAAGFPWVFLISTADSYQPTPPFSVRSRTDWLACRAARRRSSGTRCGSKLLVQQERLWLIQPCWTTPQMKHS